MIQKPPLYRGLTVHLNSINNEIKTSQLFLDLVRIDK